MNFEVMSKRTDIQYNAPKYSIHDHELMLQDKKFLPGILESSVVNISSGYKGKHMW